MADTDVRASPAHPAKSTDHDSPWKEALETRFPMAKLLDWNTRWAELEASDNVFALVVMAQIKAKTCHNDQWGSGDSIPIPIGTLSPLSFSAFWTAIPSK